MLTVIDFNNSITSEGSNQKMDQMTFGTHQSKVNYDQHLIFKIGNNKVFRPWSIMFQKL